MNTEKPKTMAVMELIAVFCLASLLRKVAIHRFSSAISGYLADGVIRNFPAAIVI